MVTDVLGCSSDQIYNAYGVVSPYPTVLLSVGFAVHALQPACSRRISLFLLIDTYANFASTSLYRVYARPDHKGRVTSQDADGDYALDCLGTSLEPSLRSLGIRGKSWPGRKRHIVRVAFSWQEVDHGVGTQQVGGPRSLCRDGRLGVPTGPAVEW